VTWSRESLRTNGSGKSLVGSRRESCKRRRVGDQQTAVVLSGNERGTAKLYLLELDRTVKQFNHRDLSRIELEINALPNNSQIFGAVLLGPKDSPLGFEMKDDAKIYYNSVAIGIAQSLCGECFPQPPKVSAWLDK